MTETNSLVNSPAELSINDAAATTATYSTFSSTTASASAPSDDAEGTADVDMLNYWYPVCFARDFPSSRPLGAQLFGEPLVVFRGRNPGEVVCLQDRCAHRSAPLSIGAWKDGAVECRYHGWQFGEDGKCVRIPSLPTDKIPQSVRVPSYPATEREGMIWVWPGDPARCSQTAGFPAQVPEWGAKSWRLTDQAVDQDYSYWCLIENLLDPSRMLSLSLSVSYPPPHPLELAFGCSGTQTSSSRTRARRDRASATPTGRTWTSTKCKSPRRP